MHQDGSLGPIELDTDLEILMSAATHHDREVRLPAVLALARINEPRALPAITLAAGDVDPDVRAAGVSALGRIAARTIPILSRAIDSMRYPDEQTPNTAAEVGTRRFETIRLVLVEPLLTALSDPDVCVRQAAVKSVGGVLDGALANRLVSCLGDSAGVVRETAASALARAGAPVPHALIVALNDVNPEVRRQARNVMRRIGLDAAPQLTAALQDDNFALRRTAAEMLEALRWTPGEDEIGAMYWLAKGDWQTCAAVGPAAVPVLVRTLKHRNAEARSLSSAALTRIGAPAAGALVDALSCTNEELRRSAATTLRALGAKGVETLIAAALNPADASRRYEACELLGEIGDRRAVDPLIEVVHCRDPKLEVVAVAALGRIGNGHAVEPLIDCLSSTTWGVPQAAAKVLGTIRDLRALEPLMRILGSQNEWVRRAAAEALGDLADERSVVPLAGLLSDPEPNVRRVAAAALGAIGSRLATQLRSLRQAVATDGNPDLMASEPDSIATAESCQRTLHSALSAAIADSDGRVRAASAKALGQLDLADAVPLLVYALGDRSSKVREDAIQALVGLGRSAVDPLVALLGCDSRDLCCVAAHTLARIGDRSATEPLLGALSSSNEWVRRAAAMALGDMRDERAVGPLASMIHDPNERVRASVAEALGKIGSEDGMAALLVGLRDESPRVRSATATALASAGRLEVVATLVNLFGDPATDVRTSAAQALVAMSSQIEESGSVMVPPCWGRAR